jgi:hypothetical protein
MTTAAQTPDQSMTDRIVAEADRNAERSPLRKAGRPCNSAKRARTETRGQLGKRCAHEREQKQRIHENEKRDDEEKGRRREAIERENAEE